MPQIRPTPTQNIARIWRRLDETQGNPEKRVVLEARLIEGLGRAKKSTWRPQLPEEG